MFPKRRRYVGSSIFVAGALLGGIAIGVTAHKFGPEIRNRVQGFVSHVDMNPFDNTNTQQS